MAEIRNYTMNFSSDITFAERKLVCTEIHRERGSNLLSGEC